MKWVWLLLLAAIVVACVFVNQKAITEQWAAMYPAEPRRETALRACYSENHQFNRGSSKARAACYEKWLPIIAREAPVR
jgi:hypothetical protein